MGRRLNVSTPTVINTELVPLDESFYLDVDGQMEQWYYDNTEQYAPNRKVTPLLLVPVISAFDKDTSTSYTPAFNTTQWFANEWNETQGKYVETEITNQVDSGSADYVIQGNNLLVKKNVSYSHAVTIRCVATYIDPRDSGVTYTVEDSVNLTTNRTADVVFPEVDIISPSGRAYNPLVDDTNSQYDFKGVTTNNPVQPLNTDVRRYPVDVDGTEEILNSGEAVAPIMDIRYGENRMTDQEFMYRQTAGGTLVGESIDKAYIERIKGNSSVVKGELLSVTMNAIQTKGKNNSWTKTQTMPITTLNGKLNGAGNSVTIFPDGLKKVGTIQDEIFVDGGLVKAIKRVGSRAYESGDESDTSVITDGSTTTFYVLTTPETYVLDPITDFVWYGIKNGQEVLADTLPWYVSGQGTDNLTVDAMYGENINVVLRCKMMDGETLSPSKAYASLNWRTPDIEPFVQSDNGGAVRGDTEDMTFDTIVNVNGEVLSDALKRKHLAFNWKIHKDNAAPNTPEAEIDKGWGQRITIDASDLRNARQTPSSTLASTLVYNHVYLKGAYEEVTDNGEAVTYNGEKVYDRPID